MSPGVEEKELFFQQYCDKVEQTEWATNVEVLVAAKVLNVKIYVWELTEDGYVLHSAHGEGSTVWHIGFQREVHYHLLVPESDADGLRRLLPHIACVGAVT